MGAVRMFRLGDGGGWVLALNGVLENHVVESAVSELGSVRGEDLIIDLMHAQVVDLDELDALVEAAGTKATFVAERPLLDALHLIGVHRYVRTEPTLAAALA